MMRKTLLALGVSLLALTASLSDIAFADPATVAVQSATKTATGLSVRTAEGILTVDVFSDTIVHVKVFRSENWAGTYNPAVIGTPDAVSWQYGETPDAYTLTTARMVVRIDRLTGALSFLDKDGQVILDEPANARKIPAADAAPQAVEQMFKGWSPIYGLGQHENGMMDYSGSTIHLQQANRDVAVPMLVSSQGFGILWNNASVTDVEASQPASPQPIIFKSEAGGGIDYDFIYGPELDDVIAGYRKLTGDAPMMARWTWGLWQSKERYASQAELLGIAAKYRELEFPLDAVVQDWQYWAPGDWGDHVMDPTRYPDPKNMLKTLHDENVHAIISVWARFDVGTDNLNALREAGATLGPVYPNVYPEGQGQWYDPYGPKGRDLYWRQINKTLGSYGFDGWWLDASEAELGGQWGQLRDLQTAAGPGREVYNAYPLLHTSAVHDGMRRDIPQKRAFILTRSAYAGQQRNGAITWSGDTTGNWENFRKQVPAALNFTLSGIPYWSADIGGFFGGDPKDPGYAELFTRWYQFGVFNPMFRVHGTGPGKEIWQFDDATQKTLLTYDRLRYRLLPYIYSASWDVTHNHGTMMRALAMDFRSDRQALQIPDQYMFGKALLVNPVMQAKANVRTVYLPGTDSWYDFWTGERFDGGQVIAARANIDTIPVFVHAGSILPLGPDIQYAEQKSAEPIDIRVYPGRDGTFELYDDAGDGYGYEKGEYATIRFTWTQADHQLRVDARQGQFPKMSETQAFRISCGASATSQTQPLVYSGSAMVVSLPACN